MGVHPGRPVCLIVAASLVAVETNVGETISAPKVAFVCGLWSVRVVALLSAGLFSCFCVHQLLFPWLEALVQSASPPHMVGCKVLPGLCVDVECFHVSLADILVAQLWAAFCSPSRCKLSIENAFWDAAILHAVDTIHPMQLACAVSAGWTCLEGWLRTGPQHWTLCLARICPGYGRCFSGRRCWVFFPVWHMWSTSRCCTSVCWRHRHCTLPSCSSLSNWGWSTLVKWGEQVLWLPSQSSYRSQCPRRSCQWWGSKDMWTVQRRQAHSHWCWWLAVPLYSAAGCWSSWYWWLVWNLCRPEKNGPSVPADPAGHGLSPLHHQRTACLWWRPHEHLSLLWGSQDWKACHLIWSSDTFFLMLCQGVSQEQGKEDSEECLG